MTREIKYRIWSNNYNKYIESYANTSEETFGEGRYGYEGYHLALRPNGKLYDADVGIDYPGTLSEIPTLNWEDESDNNEVEMCTGLKDKNGKEIYEGDIVEATVRISTPYKSDTFRSVRGKIIYGPGGSFCIEEPEIFTSNDEGSERKFTVINPLFNIVSRVRVEVIGTIHENPELLEKGEENE